MLKLLGAVLIFLGTAGGLAAWMGEEKKRLDAMEELRQFYIRAYYAMDIEQAQMMDFLENYQTAHPAMSAWKQKLTQALKSNTYPSGEEAFLWALDETKAMWNLSKEGWEVFRQSAKGLFGMNLPENLIHLKSTREGMEVCGKEERSVFAKRKKLVIPVALLGAVMMIICLV